MRMYLKKELLEVLWGKSDVVLPINKLAVSVPALVKTKERKVLTTLLGARGDYVGELVNGVAEARQGFVLFSEMS